MYEQRYQIDGDLLPLLPPYRPGRFDYYCPGPCAGVCKHRRLRVPEAYEKCREHYAATGDAISWSQILAYVEYM